MEAETISGISAGDEEYLLDKYQKLVEKETMLKLMWQDDPLNIVWDGLRQVERDKARIERIIGYFPAIEKKLTETQIHEAIGQMLVTCDLKMQDYEMVCARGVLNDLGYGEDADQIIQFIADGGFDYCLDPQIRMVGHHDEQGEFPDPDVCYFGPDQLKSRLSCLSNVPYWVRHQQTKPVA